MSSRPDDGLLCDSAGVVRCWWCGDYSDYVAYHDDEWGRPVRDDTRLFEKLCLEGFQAGLSWLTILRKRENFRRAFDSFDFERIARYRSSKVDKLLGDAGIVRHRAKIESVLNNAKRARELVDEFGSLATYVWSWEADPTTRPERLDRAALSELTASPESKAMAKDLRKRGWSFVGPTTVYAFMQSMGLVNDHLEGCATREVVEAARAKFRRPR